MQIVWFVLFLLVSHFLVLQIFRLTTYHRYFLRALPLLIGYGALAGWLLYWFNLSSFFLWWVPAECIWLFVLARRQSRQSDAALAMAGPDAGSVRLMAQSLGKTKQFYAYSSFTYILVFAGVFILAYNT